MTELPLVFTAVTHVLRGWLDTVIPDAPGGRDRGAVSLEQVLWFVAAGVSVAVVAAIVWSQIRDQADAPINTPTAP